MNREPHLEIGKLPSIQVIAMNSLLLHEDPDPTRSGPLAERIAADGCLRNPLIAARDHGTATHLLLDGANRLEALRALGARCVVIQDVDLDDEGLVLSTWHHAVEGLSGAAIAKRLRRASRVSKVSPIRARLTRQHDFIPTFTGDAACSILLPTGAAFVIRTGLSATDRLDAARAVTDALKDARNVDRVSYTNLDDLRRNYPRFSALICYRGFTKRDILEFALSGKKCPSGITRFGVPKRAVSLSVPLAFLKDSRSLAAKKTALERVLRRKIRERKIRFYQEPTFHFDD
ncbi:MAG: hypothetical protein V1694_04130 [Candidatus Eisenbacteria bacterium]